MGKLGLREKRWKEMYLRSEKLVRAQQLGFDYPRVSEQQLIQDEEMAQRLDRTR